jgi:hypothetical protein|tara:strand:+ start:7000 stop:8238 length:1239 start_codon:yes stop_codon:yes gene_type:complete
MAKSTTGSTRNQSGNSTPFIPKGVFSGRVRRVLLNPDDYPDEWEDKGGYAGMAGVFFSPLDSPTINVDEDQFALPLFPNFKQPPTHNEVVYIIGLPNPFSQLSPSKISYYYFQSINIWNSVHHNAIPDPLWADPEDNSNGGNGDYTQTEAGVPLRQSSDGDTEIKLGETFIEKLDTRALQLYEGDVTHEGRWGNSIRFGSTSNDGIPTNTWSEEGEDGDPITIIRNGQHEELTDPWIPQVEDINEDKSNIYLTSTQKIPINAINTKYSSYDNEPIIPNEYVDSQVILNSNRLIFNSRTDSILLSAEKSIFLGSNDSVNITAANKTVVECKDIKFGDKDATEPIILGNKFLADLQKLCTQLVALGTALQTPIGAGPPFVPNAAIPVPAVNVTQAAQTIINKIEKYKSKVTTTK